MSELELTGVGREVVLQLGRERRVKEFKVKARET